VSEPASRIVYRHRHHGCNGSVPLNLAERELITGRSLTQIDDQTGIEFCVDCLADLPVSGYEALFHVCGEEPAPEPAAQAEEPPQPAPAVKVPRAKVGDVVRYHGGLAGYYGSVWEVTVSGRGGLRLFDVDRALFNISPGDVTVVQTRAQRNRLLRRRNRANRS
jgi:hypothetical protein